jgi:hypothetical protein
MDAFLATRFIANIDDSHSQYITNVDRIKHNYYWYSNIAAKFSLLAGLNLPIKGVRSDENVNSPV